MLLVLRVPRLENRLAAPPLLDLVRSLSLFAPLSVGVQETLARRMVDRTVGAGTVIIAEGGVSDEFTSSARDASW